MPPRRKPEEKRVTDNVRTHSSPSDLRITDMRVAVVADGHWRWPIIRIDTNQGISGLGEVRDGASKTYALMLKSRIIGENPCDVDRIFRKIKQFGFHARQGGGVCAIEMALMDLAGKAYGVPCYQLAGGKFRDSIRIYCDTPSTPNARDMGLRLKERMERGFTFLKMDLGIDLAEGTPGALNYPKGMLETRTVQHPFTHIHVTDAGIDVMAQYVDTVRSIIGYEIPLAVDHFGHISLEDCIRIARAIDKYRLAWLEDMIPWQYADLYLRLSESCETPICTGEDIYLKDGFRDLFERRAIAVVHPDPATSGGILETKRIGDYAQEKGISMALHMAGTPVAAMAAVHIAAATENFIALENHSVDSPWWDSLVTGISKPFIQRGFTPLPTGPGLGIELNEDVVKAHLAPEDPGYFEPTPQWDTERAHDRLWS